MKKVKFINSNGFELTGVIHLPKIKTKRVVIIAHGSTAHKDRPRLIKLAEALEEIGIAVLRFDFGGCGESEFQEITIRAEIEDLKAAVRLMRDNGFKEIGLFGESLGSLVCLMAWNQGIKSLVLWASITAAKTPSIALKTEFLQTFNEQGYIEFMKEGINFKIPRQYLDERKNVNQKELLERISVPVLLIHGDKDSVIPVSQSKKAMRYLPLESKLTVIKDGNHLLEDHLDLLIKETADWFNDHL